MHGGEWFKGGLKRALRRLAETPGPASVGRSVILTYHSVGAREHAMNVTPFAFREQMRWLTDHYRVIPLAEAVDGAEGVAITFDDGYRDNLTEAAPVLESYAVPATVFFVSGRAGGYLDHDDPCDESARLMTWGELRDLSACGWEIGGHTVRHERLSEQTEARQRAEIEGCKRAIESEIGRAVTAFAYPFGSILDFTPLTVRIVREAGYEFAVSNRYGVNGTEPDRFALRRIWIDWSDTLESFAAKVEGRLDRLAWLDSRAGAHARRWTNRLLRSA